MRFLILLTLHIVRTLRLDGACRGGAACVPQLHTVSFPRLVRLQVEHEAMGLLSVAEPRLLLACLPPQATVAQPLTAAGLAETGRALALLTVLARFPGTWHVALPSSIAQFR